MTCIVKNILARRVNDYTGTLEYLVEWGEERATQENGSDSVNTFDDSEWEETMRKKDCRQQLKEEEDCMNEVHMTVKALHSCWTSRAALLSWCPDLVEAADQREITRVDDLLRRWRSRHKPLSSSREFQGCFPFSIAPTAVVGGEKATKAMEENHISMKREKDVSCSARTRCTGEDQSGEETNEKKRSLWEEVEKMQEHQDQSFFHECATSSSTTSSATSRNRLDAEEIETNTFFPNAKESDRSGCVLPCEPNHQHASFMTASSVCASFPAAAPSCALSSTTALHEDATTEPLSFPPAVERMHGIVWNARGEGRQVNGNMGCGAVKREKGDSKGRPNGCREGVNGSTPLASLPLSSPSPSSSSLVERSCEEAASLLSGVDRGRENVAIPSVEEQQWSSLRHASPPPLSSSSPYVILLGDVILSEEATAVMNPSSGHQKKKKRKKKGTGSGGMTSPLPQRNEEAGRRLQCGVGAERTGEVGEGMSIEELCFPAQKLEKDWKNMFTKSFLYSCAVSSHATPLPEAFTYTSHTVSSCWTPGRVQGSAENGNTLSCRPTTMIDSYDGEEAVGSLERTGLEALPTSSLLDRVFTRALQKWVRIVDMVPVTCSQQASLQYSQPVSILSLVGAAEAERLRHRVLHAVHHSGCFGGGNGGGAGCGSAGGGGRYPSSASHGGGVGGGACWSAAGTVLALKEEAAVVTELLRKREEQLVVRCLFHRDLGLPLASLPFPSEEVSIEEENTSSSGRETRKRLRGDPDEDKPFIKLEEEEEEERTGANSAMRPPHTSGPTWTLASIPLSVCRLAFPQLLIDYLLEHTLVLEAE